MAETTKFTSNGKTISTEVFKPSSSMPSYGVIIVAHGTDELSAPWGQHIREYAEALAERGFMTFIPLYFLSTDTPPGFRSFEPIERNRDIWQQALADAIAHATALPGVDSSRVGLLGFSLGGHLCLRLRAMAKVLVEFYGPSLDMGPASTRKLFAQVHHGEKDTVVPFNPNYSMVTDTLTKEGAVREFYKYPGAGHGFIGTDRDNTTASKGSRERALAFFTKYL